MLLAAALGPAHLAAAAHAPLGRALRPAPRLEPPHPHLGGPALRAAAATGRRADGERAVRAGAARQAWAVGAARAPRVCLALASNRDVGKTEVWTPEMAVGEVALSTVSNLARTFAPMSGTDNRTVEASILKMTRDMETIEAAAVSEAQLGTFELIILTSTVLIAACSPYVASMKLVEVLVPSMSALSAAIGISSEYTGRVAVSRGKEVAAVALQAAAESEALLAQAERAKAIIPLCVGIATTASAFSLLAPALVAELTPKLGVQIVTEIYLISPLLAVLGAAVAALATQEAIDYASRSAGTGTRRFASSGNVGRTWLSATEQIAASTSRTQDRWKYFCLTVMPAPILGIIVPGSIAFRAIIVAAVAAAQLSLWSQAAYQLTQAEYSISAGLEAVALKLRSAAVADTYANQGARAGAILPFTSALSGLCAATTVALVEALPLISAVSMQSLTATVFPAIGAVVAAAASVSKTRCELDAEAANKAANELAFAESRTASGKKKGPIIGVYDLIVVTFGKINYRVVPRQLRLLAMRIALSIRRFFFKIDSKALPDASNQITRIKNGNS